MEKKEIKQRILEVFYGSEWIDVDKARNDEARLREDLGFDSLDQIEILMDVEKEFRIRIPDAEVEKVRTVGDIIELVDGIILSNQKS